MPKQLLLAPAASGKTNATIQLAQQTAVSGHEVRICVPKIMTPYRSKIQSSSLKWDRGASDVG